MLARGLVLALFCVASCGGGSTPPPAKPAPAKADAKPEGATPAVAEKKKVEPPTEEQCTKFLDHMLELSRAERNKTAKSKDDGYTEEDAEKARAEFREKNMELCMSRDKSEIECGLSAKSQADLQSC